MDEPQYFCGTTVQAVGPLAKWPGDNPDLPWHYDFSGYTRMAREVLVSAFEQAWRYWADVVEIAPRRVDTRGEAKVWGTFRRIDGPSNVLAWSMLADNTNSPKEQRYDNGELWVKMNPETPGGGIDLVRVACHEIGHVLGLDHDAGNAVALMRPSYSVTLPGPTERDVQRLVGLGYKRRTAPTPPPPAPTPNPPPVAGVRFNLPGGGLLEADYTNKVVTYPPGWVGKVK